MGGAGDDIYIVDHARTTVAEGSSDGMDTVYTSADRLVINSYVEIVYLLEGAELVRTSHGDNVIYGNDQANDLSAGGGDDTVFGSGGDDLLTGAYGNDRLDGGAGTDTAAYSGAMADYLIAQNDDGSLTVTDLAGSDGSDTLFGIEALSFSDGTVPAAAAAAVLAFEAERFELFGIESDTTLA